MLSLPAGSVSDRDVLTKFFGATGGKKRFLRKGAASASAWREQRGWKENTPLDDWKGVTLDTDRKRVEKLVLDGNGCSGAKSGC